MYKFEPAKIEDAAEIYPDVQEDVILEMMALRSIPVVESIQRCITNSDEAWTASDEDGIICIFGVSSVSLLSDKGVPWLITSNRIQDHKKNFLKGARLAIQHWLKKYSMLENNIPHGFDRLLKWLEWAGFTVYPAAPVGRNGQLLHRIEMRKT